MRWRVTRPRRSGRPAARAAALICYGAAMFRMPTFALAAVVALAPACQRDKQASDDSSDEVTELLEGAQPAPEDVAAPPDDAETTESGLAFKVLSRGESGQPPGPSDRVKVHYTGWTTDGKMFDSSRTRGQPAEFDVGGVIAGWTEGLQLMSVGDSFRLWIPEELAYGGQPGRPQGMLVFDVELLDVTRAPQAPAELEPPADAQVTDSGLAFKVLERGDGGESPRAWDMVTVHYSGWTTDGTMFDSSVMRGQPATFPLTGVIAGWTEGLQLMSEGDSFRLWIPEELAYANNPRGPQGTLVFDVELMNVEQMPEPPAVPETVSGPPPSARKTELGVHYQVLARGDGRERPDDDSMVVVHYTGWTTDGTMFDSSVTRGEPASFPLNRVIPGWADGLKTMTVGQKSRFWIPEELAYGNNPRGPQGMLVFDVELLELRAGPPAHGHGHGGHDHAGHAHGAQGAAARGGDAGPKAEIGAEEKATPPEATADR
jgi:FKBP-type peptidyl-prolyl cis-trans isomerase